MAFDFPSSPTTGQTYSISGGPTYVYNGTAWQVLTPGNQFNRTVFTATAGQTTFSMSYVVGAVDVYRNGVKLAPADFTATNGTSIVLANGCTVGDTVEVISYPMITYSDAVKRTGDTITGDMNFEKSGSGEYYAFFRNGVGEGKVQINNLGQLVVGTTAIGGKELVFTTNNQERVRVDASGRVTIPNQPAFTAYKDNGGVYGTVGTVVFNNVVLNRGNHYNSSTGKFTAPVAGVYAFGFYAHTETVNANARVITFRKNNSGVSIIYVLPNNSREQVGKCFFIQMAAGDTMELYNDLTESWWAGDQSGMMFTGQLVG